MLDRTRSAAHCLLSRPRVSAVLLACAISLLAPGLSAQVRVPGFKPSSSGLHFINRYPNIPLLTLNIFGAQVPIGDAANGLCGGMAYVARDYYQLGLLPSPDQTSPDSFSRPPQPLFDYLVKRLFDSFDLPFGPITYMHLMDPNLPDHETDFSRAGLAPHGRAWVMIMEEWPKIKAELDLGFPSPMALIRIKSADPFQMGNNHQVLAYGYDISGLDIIIHVYDPNYPGRDDVNITFSFLDPQHTTAVTYSMGEEMFCFFHTPYRFDAPPAAPCSTTAKSGYGLLTGSDESRIPIGNGLADPAFEVSIPTGEVTCATVVPDDNFPIGPWIGSSSLSKWIGVRRINSNGPAGRYHFTTHIDLPPGAIVAGMGLAGKWASDDATVDVIINGVSTGIAGGDFTQLTPFPPLAGVGLIQPGRNTFEFVVENSDSGSDNPVGLRVEATLNTIAKTDLVVTSIAANSSPLLPGARFSASLTLSNPGNLASPATATRIYMTPSGGGSPVYLGTHNDSGLCAGCSSSVTVQMVLPGGLAAGTYTIGACADDGSATTESSEANNCATGNSIVIQGSPPPVSCDRQDFSSRRLIDWLATSGTWRSTDGKLVGNGSGEEAWIWAGGAVEGGALEETYSFDVELLVDSADPVLGRHAGVMFCSTSAANRTDPDTSGYTLDWIDRAEDHGLRLMRIDQGIAQPLLIGTPKLADPPSSWRIVVDSRSIKVYGDGVLHADVADATYRGGRFGVWAYVGEIIKIDNLSFGTGCGSVRRPFDLNQDGAMQLSDCISLLGFLFLGSPSRLPCGDGTANDPANKVLADFNGDGSIGLSDTIGALTFLFLGGAPPASGMSCLPIPGCPEGPGGGSCP